MVERASITARLLLVFLVVLMFFAIFFSRPSIDWVVRWIAEDPDQILARLDIFVGCVAVLSLPLLAGGILTYRNGSRSVASERFPPPGMWVVVDTPVETGSRAKSKGRFMQFAGVFMCLAAVGLPLFLWYIIHAVIEAA